MASIHPVSPISESLQRGHRAADRIARLADSMWSDLTGECQNEVGTAEPSGGIVYDGERLSARLEALADRLEGVRGRITNVSDLNQPAHAAAAAAWVMHGLKDRT